MSIPLFDDDRHDLVSDSNNLFNVNESYAAAYSRWREQEEHQKLKSRYGDKIGDDESDSSESSGASDFSSDEEVGFLKALSALKGKSAVVYDEKAHFYKRKSDSIAVNKESKKPKPMFLKDYERKLVLERRGELSDSSRSDDEAATNFEDLSYVHQQERLKDELKAAVNKCDGDDSEELFTVKEKSNEEKQQEETDYLKWLKGQESANSTSYSELKSLKDFWNKDDLDEGEQFLRDYILDKKYDFKSSDVKTAEGFVSTDEEEVERQEAFERKYNFRFEEPDPDFVKSYPRTIGDSLRVSDERRKETRQRRKARKEEERARVTEEIKELKNLERKGLEGKVKKLKQVSGTQKITSDLLKADFDPDEYDAKMAEIFDDNDFYANVEDDKKPVFSSDSEASDAEEVLNFIDSDRPGPSFKSDDGGSAETPQEVLNEVGPSKYDYADLIGNLPCRFRYRNVPANDFGLSVDEILKASEKDLNAWASLKKVSQYRDEMEEKKDVEIYHRKGRDLNRKKRVLPSLDDAQDSKSVPPVSSPKSEKTLARENNAQITEKRPDKKVPKGEYGISANEPKTAWDGKRKSKKARARDKRWKAKEREPTAADLVTGMADDRLKAYGLNPKKVKNKFKYGAGKSG